MFYVLNRCVHRLLMLESLTPRPLDAPASSPKITGPDWVEPLSTAGIYLTGRWSSHRTGG